MSAEYIVEVPESYALYVCGAGHENASPKPLERCAFAQCKRPTLTRYGQGSRGPRKSAAA